jgi:hypothetical protein
VAGESWTAHHFSLANALDDRPDDLPYLLRRLAEAIEERRIAPDDVLDVTIAQEVTGDGRWWSATVYWSPNAD